MESERKLSVKTNALIAAGYSALIVGLLYLYRIITKDGSEQTIVFMCETFVVATFIHIFVVDLFRGFWFGPKNWSIFSWKWELSYLAVIGVNVGGCLLGIFLIRNLAGN
jgi:hypothetical protein